MKRDTNTELYEQGFKDLDPILDDLCYYLGEDFSKLVSWIKAHKKDIKTYVKRRCLHLQTGFGETFYHNAHAVIRSQIDSALCTRGTDQFYCEAPTDDGSGEHKAGHAISDWVNDRNRNYAKKEEYESHRTWKRDKAA